MAYMNQDRKAVIEAAVKPVLAKYGIKGSLKTDRYSITLTLRSGMVDIVGDMQDTRNELTLGQVRVDKVGLRERGFTVNPYWHTETYVPGSDTARLLAELVPALQSAGYYDRSDIQTDYFDTAYYYHIHVGEWNKPYVCTTATVGV